MSNSELPKYMVSITDTDTEEVDLIIGLSQETQDSIKDAISESLSVTANDLGYDETSPGVYEKE